MRPGYAGSQLAGPARGRGCLPVPLVTHGVGRVVLTGSYDFTARLFRSWKPDACLLGETSGKNAIIVTPSADPDLAVRGIVPSAHAGQVLGILLVILVSSACKSARIARQWTQRRVARGTAGIALIPGRSVCGSDDEGVGHDWALGA